MAGRPLKYENVEALEKKIEEYFQITPREEQTITGLAVHLDTSRETLMNYQERPEFFDTVKKAKDWIEHAYEMRGLKVGNAFDIFRLKQFNWRDRIEQDIRTPDGITVNMVPAQNCDPLNERD